MTIQIDEAFKAAFLAQSGESRDTVALRGLTTRYLAHPFVSEGEQRMIEAELDYKEAA